MIFVFVFVEGGSTSSQAFMPVGCGYGPIAIEKSFRVYVQSSILCFAIEVIYISS